MNGNGIVNILRRYDANEYRVVVRNTDSPGCADIRTYTNERSARCAYASLCGHNPGAIVKLFHDVGPDSFVLACRYPF